MKARVIATGKIVDVVANGNYYDTTDNKERYYSHELDFNDTSDYWTRLEHQYVGLAMQGMLAGTYYQGLSHDRVVEDAQYIAHALVEKYKENEKAMH